jgi:gliding motility-associated-like protein
MRNIYLFALIILCFAGLNTKLYSQASACPTINAGIDQTICQGQCANLNATLQGTLATNTYLVQTIGYSPYSYFAGTQVLINIDDTWSPAIPLPFCFQFFGNTYSQLVIGSNGIVSFDATLANGYCQWPIGNAIPSNANPMNSIMAPWQDIDPSVGASSDVRYQTYGTYPCRQFVISWSNVPMYSVSCSGNAALNATSQIVLHEATNIIDIYIQNKQTCLAWNGGYAIEGIQNATGTAAFVVPGRNFPTNWTATNDGKRFMPNGAPNYTVQWLDPSNTVIANTAATVVCPVVSGTYTAILTNTTCSGPIVVQDQMNVTISPIVVTANNGGPYCPGQTISLTASAGGTDYDWVGPNFYVQNNTQNPTIAGATPAMAGVYTVTMTNAAGCTATATTTVVVGGVGTTANNTGPYCAGATISLSAGAGGIDYDWVGPNLYNQPNTQNPTIAGSAVAMSGVYTVTVTFAGGCTATATTTVVVNPLPTPTANNTGPYCLGATIQLNSPTGSATDDWVGPNLYNQPNIQNPTLAGATAAMAGVYTVTVTNAIGCSATATTTVVVNPLPTPTATNTGPYCAGATIQLNSPTGSGTDDWVGPNVYSANNVQNPTLAGATAAMGGVYTVTVTNASGCSATATTTVVVNPLPTPTANNTGPYCAGATIQLNSPTGSGTDDWAGPNLYNQANVQNPTLAGATAAMGGVYTVTVTNASGCSATATTTVVVNPLPTPTATNTGPYCPGQTIQLNSPSGFATDDWIGPNVYSVNNVQNPTIAGATAAMAGVYTVTVTDPAGCSATATTTVVVNVGAGAVANNTGPYCIGATINLSSPAGAIDYDWVGPNAFVQNNTQNPTLAGAGLINAGVYTVTVTMAGGCTGTGTTTVVVNPLPTPTANNTGPYCAGTTIQLNSPTGSGTDDWTGPLAYSSNNVQNPTLGSATVGMSGIYTVTVTDVNGCSATATTNVTVNPLPTPTANNTGPYCPGQTIQLNSPTGSATDDWIGPNVYSVNNVQNPTIAAATPAMSGVYTVTVTNGNGCSATATTTVVVNAIAVAVANNTGPYCAGATIDLSSPAGAIDYDWVGPNLYNQTNTQNPSIPGATLAMDGLYTVTVTLAGGCTGTATTNVVVNALPAPAANNTGPYCEGASIQLNSPTGSGMDDWTGPAYVQNDLQNPLIINSTVAMAGDYTVTVTDANGCSATATTAVVVNALPVAVAGNNTPICEFQDVIFNSAGGIDFDWIGPGGYNQPNTQNPSIIAAPISAAGIYTVTVTDANGCSSSATTSVVISSNLVFTANSNSPICAGTPLNLTADNIVGATYDWVGPNAYAVANTQNPTIAASTGANSGTYTVTATNAGGCTGTATVVAVVNEIPTPLFVGDNLIGCAPVCVNFTDQSAVVGSVITNWNWIVEGQASSSLQNPNYCFNNPGMYDVSLTVTSAAGCSATLSIVDYINVGASPTADFMYTPQEISILDPEVIFGNTSVGAATYAWDFGDGTNSSATSPTHSYADTGTYCVTLLALNAYGCSDTVVHCLHVKPEYTLFVPNTFTVNDDGLNETWSVYGLNIKSIVVRIFDRWGEEIFMFDDINKGWPGTKQNGNPCKQDVYVYRIEVTDGNDDFHEIMGQVNLIK